VTLALAALLMGVGLAIVVSVEKSIEDVAMARTEGKVLLIGMGLTTLGVLLGLYSVLS